MKISRLASALKPSPTLALAAKAKAMVAQGRPVISLSVGEPDWPSFSEAVDAGIKAIRDGQTKYAPASGLAGLKKAIAELEGATLGVEYNSQEVTVSTGAKFILFSAFQCLLDPGDEALIPAPYWVSYPDMIGLVGGTPKIVATEPENGFKLTAKVLQQNISSQTKMLLLNSPSNPTGIVYSKRELAEIVAVLRDHPEIVVVSDDIYNRLIFSGEEVAPHMLHVAPDFKSRLVAINGVSKTYSMTGWRVGWALGPSKLMLAMSNYQSQSVSCAAPFSQIAAEQVLREGATSLKTALRLLEERRDFAAHELSKIEGLDLLQPEGAFYLWTRIEGLFNKSFQGRTISDSKIFAELLLEHAEVAVVPGQEFGLDGYVRMSYALEADQMAEAFRRIADFVGSLSGS